MSLEIYCANINKYWVKFLGKVVHLSFIARLKDYQSKLTIDKKRYTLFGKLIFCVKMNIMDTEFDLTQFSILAARGHNQEIHEA